MTNRHAITIRYTKSKATKADEHKHHTADTNIHKQEQGNTLIPITDLSSGAALAMPVENPPGPHKKLLTPCSRRALVLQRLALNSLRTPETNCSLGKRLLPRDTARFPMLESRCIIGAPRRLQVSVEGGVKRYVPHSSCWYCALWAAADAQPYRVHPSERQTHPPLAARL
jgi:hypothetical protein